MFLRIGAAALSAAVIGLTAPNVAGQQSKPDNAGEAPGEEQGPGESSNSETMPAESTTARQKAVSLLEAGKTDEAYRLLHSEMQDHRTDPEYRFLTGMAAMETNRPGEAADHFEAALVQDPDLPRVRLELARAYETIGRYDAAQEQFNHVIQAEPPPSVRSNIDRYLAHLDGQNNWQIRVTGGYLYDDNVTAGPDSNTVDLFGIPFELDPGAQETGDSAVTTEFSFDHRLPLDNHYAIRSNFTFNSVTYFNESRFNLEQVALSSGPSYRRGAWTVALPVVLDYSRLGSERYAFGYGLGPRVQYVLSDRWLLRGSLTGQLTENWARPEREGNLWTAQASVRYRLNRQSYLEAGYRHRRENADADFLSNDLDSFHIAYYTQLPWDMSLYVRPRIGWNDYDAAQPAFGGARNETRFSLDLNLSKEIADSGFFAAIGYTYTYNDSNIDFFEFDRNQISFQISKSF